MCFICDEKQNTASLKIVLDMTVFEPTQSFLVFIFV